MFECEDDDEECKQAHAASEADGKAAVPVRHLEGAYMDWDAVWSRLRAIREPASGPAYDRYSTLDYSF